MKTRKPFLLRIDPKLFTELEAWAAQELRSVNGQMEYLLKLAVEHRKGKPLAGGEQEAVRQNRPVDPPTIEEAGPSG